MKRVIFLLFIAAIFTSCSGQKSDEPWSKDQLMPPKDLAQKIENNEDSSTLILSIGFDDPIKNSIDLGPANEKEGIDKLKTYLSDVPKDKDIVLYCGCCPMDKCPNIRPAFEVINEMGFTNAKLLELKTSVKADWLDHDFPIK